MKIIVSIIVALFVIGCSSEDVKEVISEPVSFEVKDGFAVVKETEDKKNTTKIAEKIKEKTKTLVSSVQDSTAYIVDAVKPEKIDAALLYATCKGCHGANAEKKALGKSEVIKGWNEQRIIDALNGYADGTYGGAMKGMMKSQVTKFDKKEIEALAKHISKL
ncbi:MAG: hypothetical protein Q9M32_03900 [Sulfurimonas sp.]|nr:hypothetical protein [Sulfurimonas sp.]